MIARYWYESYGLLEYSDEHALVCIFTYIIFKREKNQFVNFPLDFALSRFYCRYPCMCIGFMQRKTCISYIHNLDFLKYISQLLTIYVFII